MNITISNKDDRPIYEQITSKIKKIILSGDMKEGEMLPSMRALAKDLRISVITTKRAYEELEKEGFIVTVTGKGSYVAEQNTEIFKEEKLKSIEQKMSELWAEANLCGISADEFKELINVICMGE
ncbi:HTH-type transcriptional repressor YtrA [bioreactor metagenome]|uniref:HTH-type transcriptional repressor YtrA n=1 Tax=bioreactor metagenome TaxID=1076179 RepID=A0A644Z7H6_9ZZZZ|nr:GntR family transcriptional regulator [Candidatus Metalachnospira sp.]